MQKAFVAGTRCRLLEAGGPGREERLITNGYRPTGYSFCIPRWVVITSKAEGITGLRHACATKSADWHAPACVRLGHERRHKAVSSVPCECSSHPCATAYPNSVSKLLRMKGGKIRTPAGRNPRGPGVKAREDRAFQPLPKKSRRPTRTGRASEGSG